MSPFYGSNSKAEQYELITKAAGRKLVQRQRTAKVRDREESRDGLQRSDTKVRDTHLEFERPSNAGLGDDDVHVLHKQPKDELDIDEKPKGLSDGYGLFDNSPGLDDDDESLDGLPLPGRASSLTSLLDAGDSSGIINPPIRLSSASSTRSSREPLSSSPPARSSTRDTEQHVSSPASSWTTSTSPRTAKDWIEGDRFDINDVAAVRQDGEAHGLPSTSVFDAQSTSSDQSPGERGWHKLNAPLDDVSSGYVNGMLYQDPLIQGQRQHSLSGLQPGNRHYHNSKGPKRLHDQHLHNNKDLRHEQITPQRVAENFKEPTASSNADQGQSGLGKRLDDLCPGKPMDQSSLPPVLSRSEGTLTTSGSQADDLQISASSGHRLRKLVETLNCHQLQQDDGVEMEQPPKPASNHSLILRSMLRRGGAPVSHVRLPTLTSMQQDGQIAVEQGSRIWTRHREDAITVSDAIEAYNAMSAAQTGARHYGKSDTSRLEAAGGHTEEDDLLSHEPHQMDEIDENAARTTGAVEEQGRQRSDAKLRHQAECIADSSRDKKITQGPENESSVRSVNGIEETTVSDISRADSGLAARAEVHRIRVEEEPIDGQHNHADRAYSILGVAEEEKIVENQSESPIQAHAYEKTLDRLDESLMQAISVERSTSDVLEEQVTPEPPAVDTPLPIENLSTSAKESSSQMSVAKEQKASAKSRIGWRDRLLLPSTCQVSWKDALILLLLVTLIGRHWWPSAPEEGVVIDAYNAKDQFSTAAIARASSGEAACAVDNSDIELLRSSESITELLRIIGQVTKASNGSAQNNQSKVFGAAPSGEDSSAEALLATVRHLIEPMPDSISSPPSVFEELIPAQAQLSEKLRLIEWEGEVRQALAALRKSLVTRWIGGKGGFCVTGLEEGHGESTGQAAVLTGLRKIEDLVLADVHGA